MQLIDDGMAQHGDVVWAAHQTEGRGQRGKKWEDDPGNIKMSLIIKPEIAADQQFLLSMQVATVVAGYLRNMDEGWQVAIKWPNDIYINDKKTCGLLIENIFRGMSWHNAVIGLGLNVNQTSFDPALPHAGSLKSLHGKHHDLMEIVGDLRAGILNQIRKPPEPAALLQLYNSQLYQRNRHVRFKESDSGKNFEALVVEVDANGNLLLLTATGIKSYRFGSLEWIL